MGLKQDLDSTTVEKLNLRPAVTISQIATIRDCVVKMREAGLGCVIAVDDNGKAVGMFTEGMLRHALNESVGILDDTLDRQMVARLPWVLPSDPIKMVLEAMEEHNFRFIAVLDEDHRVLGLTGQKSLMEFIADSFPYEVLTQDPTGVAVSRQKEGA